MRKILLAATAAAMLAGAGAAQAETVIFETGFEAPDYALGALGGQQGWNTFGSAAAITVQNAVAASGSQAARIDGSAVTGQSGPWRNDPTALANVTLSADIMLTSGLAERSWQFSAIGAGLVGFTGGIDIDAGSNNIRAITNAFPVIGTFSRDVFHRVDILLDYGSLTYDVKLDGALLAAGLAFCGDNGGCAGSGPTSYSNLIFDTFGSAGDDFGYLDNVRVAETAAVPEPSMWALMILGFAGAGAMLRRRRPAFARL